MENRRREVVFWLGCGYLAYSELFLLPSLRTRHTTRNQLLALEHEQQPHEHGHDAPHEEHELERIRAIDFEATLLYKIVAAIRYAVLSLFAAFLMSNEISYLYCDGHTVLAYVLLLLGRRLAANNRTRLADRVLRVAMWWDRAWLNGNSAQLQSLLQALARIAQRSNQPLLYHIYSKRLAALQGPPAKERLATKFRRWFMNGTK